MASSRSKRPVCSSDGTNNTLSDAATRTNIAELTKTLPPDKILKEGRKYMNREKTKKKAAYWEYYIEYLDDDGRIHAECKYCDKTFAADGNINGSKNVKNHAERCNNNPYAKDKDKGGGKQTELHFHVGGGDKDNEFKYGTLNLKAVREACVRMIIIDELPFRHVEKEGFKDFVKVACPRFTIPSRFTIARDCLQLYYTEKANLKEDLKSCQRICVTTDTWTSIQRINYMCLTAHYIDVDWKLNKKIINFCPISSHKGEAIGKAVEACLESWGIEDKLLTVTVDNASSNDVACVHLKKMVERTGTISRGKFLHVRCIAHIINLIVWDGIREHGVCIERVRNVVKFVKNSPARIARFKDLSQKANVDSKSSLSFDVPTRWNSTYTMLDTALKFQRVLCGINVPESSNDNEKPPDSDDWKNVERLCWFLKGFYLLTRRISGSYYVTSNKGLFEIAAIYDMLNKWEKSVDLNFQAMAILMKKKFDKYWGNIEKMNMFIYVAVILDPHSKLLVVEITLTDMYGKEKGMQLANNVKAYAYELFDEYRNMYSSQVAQAPPSGDTMSLDLEDDGNVSGGVDYMRSLKDRAKRMKGSSGYVNSEFDRYINEQLGVEEEDMDPLAWWGCNGHRYPIVSRMARDILAIPLSTVTSESAFSAGGRHLDPFRSSLTPKMVQALICTQDWLRAKKGASGVEVEENLKDLEEIEKDVECIDLEDDVVFVDTMF